MNNLPILQPGDHVAIIAPASRCTPQQLDALKNLLMSWQLNCHIADDIFGTELFTANTDDIRFQQLKNALFDPTIKAIICARGGYGSMRLIPQLSKLSPPKTTKLFMGMSDITALHLFLQQQWQWPVIHGSAAPDRISTESINALKSILFGKTDVTTFTDLAPLNRQAKADFTINSVVTGGNLCLVETSIGTSWQIDGRNKIILLEDTGERGYRIDRMLEHLKQANIFNQAAAILFGDFLDGNEPDGSNYIQHALNSFAASCEIPVMQLKDVGHGHANFPIPMGTAAKLERSKLVIANRVAVKQPTLS